MNEAAAHFDADPSGVDGMFEAFRRLGETISAKRAADRQARKDARNARRRARYRANPPARGRKAAAVLVDDEAEHEPGCRCHLAPSPPCSWCEGGGDETADRAAGRG
ncbi:hypothetical protein [Verrucosispora sp. TAA-831]|uniref:hypothetical protein n=1 Tax=Verrucosispora sp. TAA-831 TaxID=3422227 RepID=UPI003D6F317B